MKQCVIVLFFLLSAIVLCGNARATTPLSNNISKAAFNEYCTKLYANIDFGKSEKPTLKVFQTAIRGYISLRQAGKLQTDKEILSIADFTLSANKFRLWIIDLKAQKLLYNDFVSHGQGSGEEFATAFSNIENSHQSSLGFYVTGDTYVGDHGLSLHLYGMDNGYNSAAFDRAIVIHAADYVSQKFIQENERLGRSWGCPALNPKIANKVINTIKDGTCLFIYYPQPNYIASSYWLNKKLESLPEWGKDTNPLFPTIITQPVYVSQYERCVDEELSQLQSATFIQIQ